MNHFSTYIIYSFSLDKYYIGYSFDVNKRLVEHNSGISSFTSKATDWQIKWYKPFKTREEALAEEKRIKSKKSRKYIEWLINAFSGNENV